ncbi:hypothetical protein [Collimonas pratensis]|nr:hypothetical protein [Collimonas pratensis]
MYRSAGAFTITATAAATAGCMEATASYTLGVKKSGASIVWTSPPPASLFIADANVTQGASSAVIAAAFVSPNTAPASCKITYAVSAPALATVTGAAPYTLAAVAAGTVRVTASVCAGDPVYAEQTLSAVVTVGAQKDALLADVRKMRQAYASYVDQLDKSGAFLPDDPSQATPAQMQTLYNDPNWFLQTPWTVDPAIADNTSYTQADGTIVKINIRGGLVNSMSALRYFLRTKGYALSLPSYIYVESISGVPGSLIDYRELLYITRNMKYKPTFAYDPTSNADVFTSKEGPRHNHILASDPDTELAKLPITTVASTITFTANTINAWGKMCPGSTWPCADNPTYQSTVGAFGTYASLLVHELMHSFGYNHANTPVVTALGQLLGADSNGVIQIDGASYTAKDVNYGIQGAIEHAVWYQSPFNQKTSGLYMLLPTYGRYSLGNCCS